MFLKKGFKFQWLKRKSLHADLQINQYHEQVLDTRTQAILPKGLDFIVSRLIDAVNVVERKQDISIALSRIVAATMEKNRRIKGDKAFQVNLSYSRRLSLVSRSPIKFNVFSYLNLFCSRIRARVI